MIQGTREYFCQNINFPQRCWEHKESLNLLMNELCKVRPAPLPLPEGLNCREEAGGERFLKVLLL